MRGLRASFLTLLLLVAVKSSATLLPTPLFSEQVAGSCAVTLPPGRTFVPPSPYPPQAPYSDFWYGSERLWTMLSPEGTWQGSRLHQRGRTVYRDKVFWWRVGYSGRRKPRPELAVVGRRIDGGEETLEVAVATNAHHVDFGGWTMLTRIDIPSSGCWELTGQYRNETLSFVVWVPP